MKKLWKVLTVIAGVSASASAADAQVLDFEGFADGTAFTQSQFEATHGVRFLWSIDGPYVNVSSSRACDGSGMWTNAPSGCGALAFYDGWFQGFDVAGGFTEAFSLHYLSLNGGGALRVFDGLGGSGTLLGEVALSATGSTTCDFLYCAWNQVSLTFSGTARSVTLLGVDFFSGSETIFDDIAFGRVPQSTVPEPPNLLLTGLGLAVIGFRTSRRRIPQG